MTFFRAFALLTSTLALAACSSSTDGSEDDGLSRNPAINGGTNGPGTLTNKLECPASPAQAVFGNAVCICGDFTDVGNLIVRSALADNAGSIGVNGISKVINNTNVSGSWASHGGFSAIGNVQVGKSLYTTGDLHATGNLEVKENLSVGGGLSGIGRVAVGGELRTAGSNGLIGYQQIHGKGGYVAPAGLPCGCDGLDVAQEVAKAKDANDNAAHKLPTSMDTIGVADLTLTTGRYFFGDMRTIGLSKIHVTGAVSMYLDGDLDDIGAQKFDFAPGASLDLYVSGSVKTIGYANWGDKAQPSAFRLYVGGSEDISLQIGAQIFHGAIYAPKAILKYVGYTKIEGALFAKEVHGIGDLEIGGARPVNPPANICTTPASPAGSGSSGGTASTPPSVEATQEIK